MVQELNSSKWHLNQQDLQRWLYNSMVFLSPLGIMYALYIIENINKDGFQLNDFVLNNIIIGAIVLYALNTLLDLFRKFSKDNTK